ANPSIERCHIGPDTRLLAKFVDDTPVAFICPVLPVLWGCSRLTGVGNRIRCTIAVDRLRGLWCLSLNRHRRERSFHLIGLHEFLYTIDARALSRKRLTDGERFSTF